MSNWFGKGCQYLCAQWEDNFETGGPNYQEAEPSLVFCNHKDNPEGTEGNCRGSICPLKRPEYLYRYEDILSAYFDDSDITGTYCRIILRTFKIVKYTKKGVWISLFGIGDNHDKFILMTARKKWACKTEKEAIYSYQKRKQRQIQIYESRLKRAKQCLLLCEKLKRGLMKNI